MEEPELRKVLAAIDSRVTEAQAAAARRSPEAAVWRFALNQLTTLRDEVLAIAGQYEPEQKARVTGEKPSR